MKRTTLLVATLALASLGATAQAALAGGGDDIELSRQRQQERIANGVRSGQLTRHEAADLERQQANIDGMIRRARVDGRIDPYERNEISRAQAAASQRIYSEKHDSEARPSRWWGGWHGRGYDDGYRPWYRRWY